MTSCFAAEICQTCWIVRIAWLWPLDALERIHAELNDVAIVVNTYS